MNKLYLLELYIMNRPDLGVLGSIRRNLKGSLRLHNLHRLDIYCSKPGTTYIIHMNNNSTKFNFQIIFLYNINLQLSLSRYTLRNESPPSQVFILIYST